MSITPILDLEEPLPTVRNRRWIGMLSGAIIGLGIASIPILIDQGVITSWNWPTMNGLLLIPILFVGVAVHELGHLLAGKLAGFDTGGITVGPLSVGRSGKNWTIDFAWRSMLRLGGFFKPLLPAQGTIDAAYPVPVSRYIWMIAGGPAVSVLSMLFCGLWSWRYGSGPWGYIGTAFWVNLVWSVLSLVPFRSGLQKSDGARLWQLIRHPETLGGFVALLGIQTEETRGIRPKEWSEESVSKVAAIEPYADEYFAARFFLFYRWLDENKHEEALLCLERLLALSARARPLLRAALFVEAGYACAWIRAEPGKARVWRQTALPLLKHRPQVLCPLDASLAMSDGRYEEALGLWQAARAETLRLKLDSGLARMALEIWAECARSCEERIAGSAR